MELPAILTEALRGTTLILQCALRLELSDDLKTALHSALLDFLSEIITAALNTTYPNPTPE